MNVRMMHTLCAHQVIGGSSLEAVQRGELALGPAAKAKGAAGALELLDAHAQGQ